jgi:pyruvate formate lyase activating enzyme
MIKIGGLHKVSLIDFPGKISAIVFMQGCNFRCPYCHNPELVIEKLYGPCLEEEDILAFLEKRRGKLDAVTITGGEPTLQEGLPEFIRRVRDLGFLIKLDTNGSHSAMIRSMIEKNLLDYIAMDIKGPLQRYDRVCRVNVDKDEIESSVRAIMNASIDYEFRTTLVENLLSPEDIRAMGELLRGARLFVLQNFTPSKTLDERYLNRKPLSPEDLGQIKSELAAYVKKIAIRS